MATLEGLSTSPFLRPLANWYLLCSSLCIPFFLSCHTASMLPNMQVQSFTSLAHTLQTFAVAAIFVAAGLYLQKTHFQSHIRKPPASHNATSTESHRKQYLKSAKRLYREGYEKFRDSVWCVTSADGIRQVVIGPSLLPGLGKLSSSKVSCVMIHNTRETISYLTSIL